MENDPNVQPRLHSEEYFGEQRNHWWNLDFVELMAKRCQLHNVHSLLDVGCGVGHWGRLLAPFLAKDAQIVGVDREEQWVQKSQLAPIARPARYQIGDAQALPFADNSFDMVTCQTVLIHLYDPQKALSEFLRVLKPGGLLLVAEPNNICQNLVKTSLDVNVDLDLFLQNLKFEMMCERGKILLQEGDGSIGDRIPQLLSELGVSNISVHQSDKCFSTLPPYNAVGDQETIELLKKFKDGDHGWWKHDAERYFFAAGGTQEEFDRYWIYFQKRNETFLSAMQSNSYYFAGGQIFYLISARK
ncbi:class I SAM-dependent methyltransferase [Bdellovibrio sp. HCB290]|uniref:class I SAM-dependent methyltransferase n=1 Tax=Bdellovibrio sp. HCB290 TaxID=3394356 RepID=UPI0039B59F78